MTKTLVSVMTGALPWSLGWPCSQKTQQKISLYLLFMHILNFTPPRIYASILKLHYLACFFSQKLLNFCQAFSPKKQQGEFMLFAG